MRPICLLLFIVLVFSCGDTNDDTMTENTTEFNESILSASVAFSFSDASLADFFKNPSLAYVSGYFYFEEDLAEDIIFGLDVEHLEGLENPIRFEGADWMALAGFNRNGVLWFPVGRPENRDGVASSTQKWEIRDFETKLLPNIWYKMTIVCNYETLEFLSVTLEGNETQKTVSLAGFPLDYPNYAPFDGPSLTSYTFALRGLEFVEDKEAGVDVYFDDIQTGIWDGAQFISVFTDGFENQTSVAQLPFTSTPLLLNSVMEEQWYLENEEAKLTIVSNIKRTGQHALKCSADLRK
ncbi:hypothetical protein [uncultured Croceitalea sp.]|uniref:hypothetical protein n=1 Tax=uncultured Croceitalea sp. TaxID=1798908 RepID=UPI00330636B6